jgi:sulfotransferase
MSKQFHFISGLPRSGTTLLSTILNQNPKFQASISGPLARFARSIITESSAQGGYRLQCPEEKRKNIIHGIFDNYYDDSSKETVFDTNRGWTLLTPLIKELYPQSKMIVCVRSIPWILDSFEQLVRKNALATTSMFAPEENISVYTRSNTLMRSDRTLGFAFEGLKQALTSNERNSIYVLEYDKLAKRPEQAMKEIYQFIGQPYFAHDYNNVEVSYDEFDDDVQLKGLHTTRKKVGFVERQMIIPPDLQQQYANYEFWRQMK